MSFGPAVPRGPALRKSGNELTDGSDVEIFPAFEYATEPHITTILQEEPVHHSPQSKTATFQSKTAQLQLDVSIDRGEGSDDSWPIVRFTKVKKPGMLGEGVVARVEIFEGQAVSFVIRDDKPNHVTENITSAVLDTQQHDTQAYWYNWISRSKYKGRWREVVARSLMILKLMTYEPTGAIIAAPTFSIPEEIGGVRFVFRISPIIPHTVLTKTTNYQTKQLGLSLLVGPRLQLHHLYPAAPGLYRRSRRLHGLHQRALPQLAHR